MSEKDEPKGIEGAIKLLSDGIVRATPDQLVRIARLGQLAKVAKEIRGGSTLALGSPFRLTPIELERDLKYLELINRLRLREQFEQECERYRALGLGDDLETSISFDQVLSTLPFKELEKVIAEEFKDPRLIIVKEGISFSDLMKSWLNDDFPYSRFENVRLKSTHAYIIEGCEEAEPFKDEDISRRMGSRMRYFSRYKRELGVGGVNSLMALHFFTQSRREGRFVDGVGKTILDQDPLDHGGAESYVMAVVSNCSATRPYYHSLPLSQPCPEASFRRSVGGAIKKPWLISFRPR